MNILEHKIYKDIYDLCREIEKLPASEQATKIVVMAGNLEQPAKELLQELSTLKAFVEQKIKDEQATRVECNRLRALLQTK